MDDEKANPPRRKKGAKAPSLHALIVGNDAPKELQAISAGRQPTEIAAEHVEKLMADIDENNNGVRHRFARNHCRSSLGPCAP